MTLVAQSRIDDSWPRGNQGTKVDGPDGQQHGQVSGRISAKPNNWQEIWYDSHLDIGVVQPPGLASDADAPGTKSVSSFRFSSYQVPRSQPIPIDLSYSIGRWLRPILSDLWLDMFMCTTGRVSFRSVVQWKSINWGLCYVSHVANSIKQTTGSNGINFAVGQEFATGRHQRRRPWDGATRKKKTSIKQRKLCTRCAGDKARRSILIAAIFDCRDGVTLGRVSPSRTSKQRATMQLRWQTINRWRIQKKQRLRIVIRGNLWDFDSFCSSIFDGFGSGPRLFLATEMNVLRALRTRSERESRRRRGEPGCSSVSHG